MKKAYKMFRVDKNRKGQLFPLFVLANEPTPIGEWIDAKIGEKTIDEKGNQKVKSKLGNLAFRPAWHSSDIPLATHIGVKGDSGKIEYMNDNHVWCEVFYNDDINYQDKANENGYINGKFIPKKAYIDYIPKHGFYRYKTNPNQLGDWILHGEIFINRVLTDVEVREILQEKGYQPMFRKNGDINLSDYNI